LATQPRIVTQISAVIKTGCLNFSLLVYFHSLLRLSWAGARTTDSSSTHESWSHEVQILLPSSSISHHGLVDSSYFSLMETNFFFNTGNWTQDLSLLGKHYIPPVLDKLSKLIFLKNK
jgi:hypothetical protein